jgi:Cu(I)/Ag(I) efflux system membrane protein CusA/SilA
VPNGGTVPLGEVASVKLARGPTTIRTENGQLATHIYVDIRDRDLGSYVAEAQKAVAASVKFPTGYYVTWSGQFEYRERAESAFEGGRSGDAARYLPAPPSQLPPPHRNAHRHAVGAVRAGGRLWPLCWLGFNLSVAVAVGFIALAGVAAETGMVMLIYLDHALVEFKAKREAAGLPFTQTELHAAIMSGAVERVRPRMMLAVAIMAGLLPFMWSTGTGSEVMPRIAVPMIGGMISSTLLTLIVIPAIYGIVRGWNLPRARPVEPTLRAGRLAAKEVVT